MFRQFHVNDIADAADGLRWEGTLALEKDKQHHRSMTAEIMEELSEVNRYNAKRGYLLQQDARNRLAVAPKLRIVIAAFQLRY